MSERLRGGVAAAVAVHFAGNGAAGLFPTSSTTGALVATAIALALHVCTTFDRRAVPAVAC